jgi:hypothetical protein
MLHPEVDINTTFIGLPGAIRKLDRISGPYLQALSRSNENILNGKHGTFHIHAPVHCMRLHAEDIIT